MPQALTVQEASEASIAASGGTFRVSTHWPLRGLYDISPYIAGFVVGYRDTESVGSINLPDAIRLIAGESHLKWAWGEGSSGGYIGTWRDPSTGFWDVQRVRVFGQDERDAAMAFARGQGQRFIWDACAGGSVPTEESPEEVAAQAAMTAAVEHLPIATRGFTPWRIPRRRGTRPTAPEIEDAKPFTVGDVLRSKIRAGRNPFA